MLATSFPRETLLHVVKTLPAAPQVLARLGRMLLDLNADLNDVTALLRCDAALTTRIIRVSNSAAYNIGTPYASIEQALARVGFSEVYRITGIAAVAQIADQNLALYGLTGARLRENSLLTAQLMEALARPAGLDPRMAYTAGLLRSTGKIALDRLTRDPAYNGSYAAEHGWPLAKWERDFTGLNNCEAAAFILNEWRFPAATIMCIGDHYLPGASSTPLAHLLNLAAGAAERAGHGLPGESSYWELRDEKFGIARVSADQLAAATEEALTHFERLRVAIG
jgi:HD-like signal output (HDOD) protein